MAEGFSDESRMFLSTLPAERGQRRLAMAVVLVSTAVFAATMPFVEAPLARVPAFVPAYESALILCDLLTAALLFGQFGILRFRGLALLALAYLSSALFAVAHLLTFPGTFSSSGLLGAGPQTAAWLYVFWHGGFPVLVIAYALSNNDSITGGRAVPAAAAGIAAVALAVLGFTLLATVGHDLLPAVLDGREKTPVGDVVVSGAWVLSILALGALWRRRPRTVLDLWLMVAMWAWLFDIALSTVFNAGRYDLGFYVGRVYGLLASAFVLIVLVLENGVLYAWLVRANESLEHRIGERTAELAASNRELRRSREELHEMAAAGAAAREQEKSRIARELHDELGQALAALRMDLAWLEENAPAANERGAAKMAAMRELLDGTTAATRRIASDLRPLMLDDLGLVPAAEWLVQSFQRHHGIECRLTVDPPELDLADPQSTAVFRIMQESLTNVARHAGASRVEVSLSRANGAVRLRVRDNGRGFDPAGPRRPGSFGLTGLRERAQLVSGEITVDAAPGRGTTIEVSIPL